MIDHTKDEKATLLDRLAIGLFSSVLTILTLLIIYLLLAALGFWHGFPGFSTYYLYAGYLFTGLMFVLGFLLKTNLLEKVFDKVWNAIYQGIKNDG